MKHCHIVKLCYYLSCLLLLLSRPLYAAGPVGDIYLNVDQGVAPLTIEANAAASFSPSGAQIKTYLWTTSDGKTKTAQTPNFIFEVQGEYILTLVVIDDNNLRSLPVSKRISVLAQATPELETNTAPVARIIVDQTTGTAPFDISVSGINSNDADGSIKYYYWRTSNGQTSSDIQARFRFDYPGQYNLNLLVLDDKDGYGSANQIISVNAAGQTSNNNIAPVSLFTMSQNSGSAPLALSFDASASYDTDGDISEYYWFSSDGQEGLGPEVETTFTQAGSYNITLRVTDNHGLQGFSSQTVMVTQSSSTPPINQPPVADFSYTPKTSSPPTIITVDGRASLDADGIITQYRWLSSDGQEAFGETAQLNFKQAGIYGITLRVSDDDGASSYKTQLLELEGSTSNTPVANLAPLAEFDLSQDATDPFLIRVDGSASSDPDGNNNDLKFAWRTSYGAQDSGVNTQFRLPDYGAYSIILTVTDPQGAKGVVSHTIDVPRDIDTTEKLPPIAAFSMTPEGSADIPLTLALDASESRDFDGIINAYHWQISDQRRLIGSNAAFTIERAGRYNISLTVIDNDGLRSSLTKTFFALEPTVTVPTPPEPPVADFDVQFPEDSGPDEPTTISHLNFSELRTSYREGDQVILDMWETPDPSRTENVDLWAAIKTEDGRLFFLNNNPGTPLNTTPQALKRSISIAERQQHLFRYEIPPAVIGRFDIYALYVSEGANPMTDGFTVLRSNILLTQLLIVE